VTIGQIVEQTRATCLYLWKRLGKRFMVSGHSVGGHLAACLMATDWKSLAPDAPGDLTSVGYAISGIYDLAPILHLSGNAEFKLDAAEAKRLSPLFWPVGQARVLDAVVGGIESSEFLRHSREIANEWGKRGVETRYEAVPGKNHFDICDPMSDPNSAMTKRMVELAKRT
jgi:arylformamidase